MGIALDDWACHINLEGLKIKQKKTEICVVYDLEGDVARILLAPFGQDGTVHGKNVVILQLFRNRQNMH